MDMFTKHGFTFGTMNDKPTIKVVYLPILNDVVIIMCTHYMCMGGTCHGRVHDLTVQAHTINSYGYIISHHTIISSS